VSIFVRDRPGLVAQYEPFAQAFFENALLLAATSLERERHFVNSLSSNNSKAGFNFYSSSRAPDDECFLEKPFFRSSRGMERRWLVYIESRGLLDSWVLYYYYKNDINYPFYGKLGVVAYRLLEYSNASWLNQRNVCYMLMLKQST
jgi:hypothetical protein